MTVRAILTDRKSYATFTWRNSDGTPSIYIGVENAISLVMTNASDAPLTFGPDGSLTLDFQNLVERDAVRAATWAANGWAGGPVDLGSGYWLLQLTPQATVTIPVGGTLTTTIGSLTTGNAPAAGNVECTAVASQGAMLSCSVMVSLLNPPQPGSKPFRLGSGFANDIVTVNPGLEGVSNELTLYLVNQNGAPVTWDPSRGGNTPSFLLSFLYGPNAGDLTTAELGSAISVSTIQEGANTWKVTPSTGAPNPSWSLQPAGEQIFGTDADAIVALSIGSITTNALAGITAATIAYTGLPGFDDGTVTVKLQKVAPIQFAPAPTATPATVDGTKLPATVTLSYAVTNATYVTIVNANYAKAIPMETFSDSVSVPVTGPTTFTLIATNAATGQTATAFVPVAATPSPYGALPPGAIVMWSGSYDGVPEGWAVCDGRTVNGMATPNLVGSFVRGASPTGAEPAPNSGNPAGDDHVHGVEQTIQVTTQTDGSHFHDLSVGNSTRCSSGDIWVLTQVLLPRDPGNGGEHQHTFDVIVNTTSDTQKVSTSPNPPRPGVPLPPWYALLFIMKTF